MQLNIDINDSVVDQVDEAFKALTNYKELSHDRGARTGERTTDEDGKEHIERKIEPGVSLKEYLEAWVGHQIEQVVIKYKRDKVEDQVHEEFNK